MPTHLKAQQDTLLNKAIELFGSGDYEQALPIFKVSISNEPSDAMLNYYYGACLAEQGIFTDETSDCLLKALTGNTPDKVYYYVGRTFESQGQWNSALKYYNRFKNFGTDTEKATVVIQERIDYCYAQANQGNATCPDTLVVIQPENPVQDNNSQAMATQGVNTSVTMDEYYGTESSGISLLLIKPQFSFQINSEIEYLTPGHFKNPDALTAFTEGSQAEGRLKEIIAESDSLRNAYEESAADREAIAQKILEIEQESMELKNLSETLFGQARTLEQKYWENISEVDVRKFQTENERLKKMSQPEPEKEEITEEALTSVITEINDLPEEPEVKTAAKPANEIIFKIQLGTYKVVPATAKKMLDKLALIREINQHVNEKGVTVYTTGNLTNFDDALKMQNQVRQEGVKDAFVVAYKNGGRININEAREIVNKK